MMMCNHDISDLHTSIVILPEEFLVYPPQKFGFCPHCQQAFRFRVNEDHSLSLIKEEEADVDE